MTISLLASCGGKSPEPEIFHKVNFDGGEYLSIDVTECKDQTDLFAKISLKEQYLNNYEVPQIEYYYEITCNDKEIKDFRIYSNNNHNHVYLEIPKEEIVGDINIKTEGYCHYLTFTGETDESKIYYYFPEVAPVKPIDIKYCNDLTKLDWQDWAAGEENAITLKGDKKTIYVWNKQSTLSTAAHGFVSFNTGSDGSSNVLSDGNIMSLVNFSGLSHHCFLNLFNDCKSLVSTPVLPATALVDYCYSNIFQNSGIRVAPKLPATVMVDGCYGHMFYGCSSLVEAPKLPASSPSSYCYESMFCGCTSLRCVPLIAFKSFGKYSFGLRMFEGCSTLSYIKVCFEEPMLPNDPTEYRLMNWVVDVAAQGTFVCPQVCADKDTYNDFSGKTIPVGWTIDNDMSH